MLALIKWEEVTTNSTRAIGRLSVLSKNLSMKLKAEGRSRSESR